MQAGLSSEAITMSKDTSGYMARQRITFLFVLAKAAAGLVI